MMIRPLTIDELPLCLPHGARFHSEMNLPGQFLPDVWLTNWQTLLTSYPSVLLSLWHDQELIGGLGGMISPDFLDARLCATELFWFMDRSHRNGLGAVKLLKAFEAWADEKGAHEVRMVRLTTKRPPDDRLDHVYTKLGYIQVEVWYRKPLVKES